MSEGQAKAPEMVTMSVDGTAIQVPKGMNVILAARAAGVDIPHYCYHPNLSIAGNCRMCQIEVEGQPKLAIGCNMTAAEGLKIKTHFTSKAVEDAQKATLEFLLINHPLDCTVCDQAGHCKLQDYHYEFNGRGSRFIEDKVHKVKAEPLGPEVVYDGERCIMCTRCVRFCDEVTNTSELAGYNRGDRGVISVFPGKALDNALSGTVVDLCPVGALTHRRWRFNSRIWYSSRKSSICTGCSTGCNVDVAVRDDRIVQVKARENQAVNKEWMCDEGRYGFERFRPAVRLVHAMQRSNEGFAAISTDAAVAAAARIAGSSADDAIVFLSPFLTVEELWAALGFAEKVMGVPWSSGRIAVQVFRRELTPVQAVLISPDYAPNARGAAVLAGVDGDRWRESLEERSRAVLDLLRHGGARRILFVGDGAVPDEHADQTVLSAMREAAVALVLSSVGFAAGALPPGAAAGASMLLPSRTVNERSGVMINRDGRAQRLAALLTAPFGTLPEWEWLMRIAAAAGKPLAASPIADERSLLRVVSNAVPALRGATLRAIGETGIPLGQLGAMSAEAGSGQSEAQRGVSAS